MPPETQSQVPAKKDASRMPALRFPEFSGEWEEKRFCDFLIPTLRMVPKPNVPYLAIGIRSHFKGTFQKPESDPNKIEMDILYSVAENDLIVNITFAWEGAVAIVKKEDEGGLVSHRFPTYTFKDDEMACDFFRYIFPKERLKYDLSNISPGGAGRNRVLSKKDFLKLKTIVPGISEQQKIAEFLGVVDEKIEYLSKKKKSLEKYKKGVMQKIFSQQIRFKDENGNSYPDWGEKKLGEISGQGMYGMNSSAIKFDGVHKYIRITDIDDQSRRFKPNPLTSPDGNLEDKYKLITGDILFVRTGASVGKSYLYNNKDGNLYFAGFLIKFSIQDADPYFVFTQTLTERYNKWVKSVSMRSGQPGINAEEYYTLKLHLPCLVEQKKIAEFFMDFDEKISAVKTEIIKAKEFKKGLLQRLLV